jgi:integrase
MSYRYEKRLPGIGPVRRSTKLTDPAEIATFEALMLDLARRKPEVVHLFRDRQIDAHAILRANEREALASLIPDAGTIVPLGSAVEGAWIRHRKGGATVVRYRTAFAKFYRQFPLPAALGGTFVPETVADLARVDWDALAGRWGGSPSDWMAFYRAMSTFLTLHFGGRRTGRAHPFRMRVLDLMPRKAEPGRVPTVTPGLFWRVLDRIPDYVQPVYIVLAGTGLRVGEFLSIRPGHLRAETAEIIVPGTKTEASAAVVPLDPAIWPWVEAAIPSPVQYKWLRLHWVRACREEGLSSAGRYDGPRVHDLRHCTGQWAVAAGADEAAVQQFLRHTDPKTTRRYTVQQMRSGVSSVVTRVLFNARAA